MLTIFIIIAALAALIFAGDVHSTALNNDNPNIFEANRRYRRPDGHADLGKLIRDKAVVFGVILTASIVLFAFGAGYFAAAPLVVIALVTAPTVIKNYSLYHKYNK